MKVVRVNAPLAHHMVRRNGCDVWMAFYENYVVLQQGTFRPRWQGLRNVFIDRAVPPMVIPIERLPVPVDWQDTSEDTFPFEAMREFVDGVIDE